MTDPAEKPKIDLRTSMRSMLAAMTGEERHVASTRASSRLIGLELFKHATVVMLYMPLAQEVDTTLLAIRCFQRGKNVCVPKVDWQRRDMSIIEVSSFDDRIMEVDEHGVRTPRRGRLVVPSSIDLVIVPGLAFDTHGRRLGRGGGYYDRFMTRLRRSARTVGFAFDDQIVETVPVSDHDVSVDLLVTDRRVTRTRASRSRK